MTLREKIFLACILGFILGVQYSPKISYGGNSSQDSIWGNWQELFPDCENGMLNISDTHLILSSSSNILRHSYITSNSITTDGSTLLKLFDTEVSSDKGLSFMEVGGIDTINASVYMEEEILVLLIWKGGDRSGEYQIAVAYTKKNEGEPLIYQPTIHSKFYLPNGYIGYSWVAMDQPDGEPVEYDMDGHRVLRIPESGLLLTRSQPMPTSLAKREFAFYYQINDGVTNEIIPVIPENFISYITAQKLSDEKIKEYGFDPNQVYVYYYRYNNPARENINRLFEKEIKGQVFWFRIDTLKNLLKSEPMLPRLQRMEDSEN